MKNFNVSFTVTSFETNSIIDTITGYPIVANDETEILSMIEAQYAGDIVSITKIEKGQLTKEEIYQIIKDNDYLLVNGELMTREEYDDTGLDYPYPSNADQIDHCSICNGFYAEHHVCDDLLFMEAERYEDCSYLDMDETDYSSSMDEYNDMMDSVYEYAKQLGGKREILLGTEYNRLLSEGYTCLTSPHCIQDCLERYNEITVNHKTKEFVIDSYGNYACEQPKFVLLEEDYH
jgi:hypothetical protein